MQTTLTFDHEFDSLYNNYAQDPDRAVFLELEGISRDQLDVAAMSRKYFTERVADVSVDKNANANESKSPNNYSAEVVKGIMKLDGYYLLWKYAVKRYGLRIANKAIRSIWDGDLYMNDATQLNTYYCYSVPTYSLMVEGRPYGQLFSAPPKRADSYIAQVIEFTMDVSQSQAGAVGLPDILVNYSWYAKRENKTDYQILNDLQKFVHVMNNLFRTSGQSPFTNVSLFDRSNLSKIWGDEYRYPDGTGIDIEYVMRVQKLFGNMMSVGINGRPYRFPLCSINIAINEAKDVLDEDFFDWACEANLPLGAFNMYINDSFRVATCCRLSNDRSRMKFRVDALGGASGISLGSARVCSINLPRIALRSVNEEEFFKGLDNKLEMAKKLLVVHREDILKDRIKGGFLQFFKPLDWFNLDHLFSTIGIIGVYEMVRFMGMDIKSPEGAAFVERVLTHIEKRLDEFSAETLHSFNCEEIPKLHWGLAC